MSDRSELGKRSSRDEDDEENEDETQKKRQCNPVQNCVSRLKHSSLTRKNKNILCKNLYNITEYNHKQLLNKTKGNPDDIQTYFKEFLHLWFYDSVIVSKILKSIATKDPESIKGKVCVNDWITFRELLESEKTESNESEIREIEGAGSGFLLLGDTPPLSLMNFRNYIKKNRCYALSIITPINFSYLKKHPEPGQDPFEHHMTMTYFDMMTNTVEFFNPGRVNNERSFQIMKYIMSKVLVGHGELKFVDLGESCPFIGRDLIHKMSSAFGFHDNTCTTFSIWYAFERVLFPAKNSQEILREIYLSLGRYDTVYERIRTIILTFLRLVDINFDTCEVTASDGTTETSELLLNLKKGGKRKNKRTHKKKNKKLLRKHI